LTGNLSDDDSSVIPSLTGNLSDDDSSVIPDSDRESNWTKLTYNIFEVPEADGNLTQRLSLVKETKYLKLIKQIKVKSKKHLKNFQKEIEDKGGEGVVVRDGTLPYYTGRNNNALKVKSFLDDECTVTQHLDGSGKYKNKELIVHENLVDFASNISVIYMRSFNKFIILDEQTYNSSYIQMMVLEKYNKELFEPVSLTPLVKVYKLKI
jgi:hypothetical protein